MNTQVQDCIGHPFDDKPANNTDKLNQPTDGLNKKVTVEDIQWNLRIAGCGPVCLMLHGTGASMHTWDSIAPLLLPHFTLVMVDLPGHANTLTPAHVDLSLPGIAKALHALMANEQIQPQLIIGHSAGAAIMMQMCLDHPEINALLVSINGAVIPLGGIAGFVFSPLARMSSTSSWMSHFFAFRARNPRNVRKLLNSTGSVLNETSIKRYAQLFQNQAHVSGVLRMMASWQLERLAPQLGKINNQVHLIASDNDRTIALRDSYRLNAILRHSMLSVIPEKGHLIHEEDPAVVVKTILENLIRRDDTCTLANTI